MNLKVANLIAIQLGIFVGIMSWLTYSRLESSEPHIAAETQARVTQAVVPAQPGIGAEDQRPSAVDYRADRDEDQPIVDQPAPVMRYQYSPEAVQQNSALAAQLYYQQIAPRRYASSGAGNVAQAPAYAEVAQEPVVQADYPEPQTVADAQPTQVVYQQPQLVVFSSGQSFRNRCRPAPHRNALAAIADRRPNRGAAHLGSSRECRPAKSFAVVQRRNDKMASCRPTDGFRPRGRR
jgi:hypothetical protein